VSAILNKDINSTLMKSRGYEAIILAGGLGTRLKSMVPDLPKCMAPVAGKPFLRYIIDHLQKQGVDKFIFALGFLHEGIEAFIKLQYPDLDVQFSIEQDPLGTGGAIKLACSKATRQDVLVLNGDTLFSINISTLVQFHLEHKADCTLSLKPMKDFSRYGSVEMNADHSIAAFHEKQFFQEGLINGGVYALNVHGFLNQHLPQKFSFEKDYFEKLYPRLKMYGVVQDTYFIDIGIPEDFIRANTELNKALPEIDLSQIDKTWTLFLDRDGVINHEKNNDYIHTWDEFVFYDGVLKAIKIFAAVFGRIVIVTNQKGIGKGLTKPGDLRVIHNNMIGAIEKAGGRIDAVYFCPDLDESSPNRKPNPGMGQQAKKDFPEIDFSKAIMVGNTISDMAFGRNLGLKTIFLNTTRPEINSSDDKIDAAYPSLIAFALEL
jgi:D-glycero-alpha-D-manno-heptose 1-phosphate guanylyltransferase